MAARFEDVLFVGTGNVGLMHGWALAQGGVGVTHVVRPGRGPVGDVPLDVLDAREDPPAAYPARYRPRVVDRVGPDDRYDLLVVATNHLQAGAALRQYAPLLPRADVLMFCANWRGPGEVDAVVPRERCLWGYSTFSGARGDDGVLYANVQRTFRVGALPGTRPGLLQQVEATFAAGGVAPDEKADIVEWLWVHQAVNAGLIGTCLAQGDLPSADTPHEVWRFIVRAVRDALRVLEARGAGVRGYPDVAVFLIDDEDEAARRLRDGMLAAPHLERTRRHGHFGASPAEMRRFYWDVVETGDQLGVPMPYLGTLREAIPR